VRGFVRTALDQDGCNVAKAVAGACPRDSTKAIVCGPHHRHPGNEQRGPDSKDLRFR
jgi:hypothetical protein